jgi:membrane fusion protein, heavy metal efflux system
VAQGIQRAEQQLADTQSRVTTDVRRAAFAVLDSAAAIEDAEESEHARHAHGESDVPSIALSERGLKNIGFRPETVSLRDFVRTVSVPAMVAEKPGQTQIHLASPVGGVLTDIYVVQGEAILPASRLFDVRLTHEELVTAQQDYLKTAESLDVVDREMARLQSQGEGALSQAIES